jgi:hypothetical protein
MINIKGNQKATKIILTFFSCLANTEEREKSVKGT